MPRRRKARSRVKNRKKNATVERRVTSRRTNVKMNQPCINHVLECLGGKLVLGNETNHQEEAESIVEGLHTLHFHVGLFDVETAGREDDGKGEPEATIG